MSHPAARFHHVTGIETFTRTLYSGEDGSKSYYRTILATDKDDNVMEIVLFADKEKHLVIEELTDGKA